MRAGGRRARRPRPARMGGAAAAVAAAAAPRRPLLRGPDFSRAPMGAAVGGPPDATLPPPARGRDRLIGTAAPGHRRQYPCRRGRGRGSLARPPAYATAVGVTAGGGGGAPLAARRADRAAPSMHGRGAYILWGGRRWGALARPQPPGGRRRRRGKRRRWGRRRRRGCRGRQCPVLPPACPPLCSSYTPSRFFCCRGRGAGAGGAA